MGPRYGKFCSLLPQLAWIILTTWGPHFDSAVHKFNCNFLDLVSLFIVQCLAGTTWDKGRLTSAAFLCHQCHRSQVKVSVGAAVRAVSWSGASAGQSTRLLLSIRIAPSLHFNCIDNNDSKLRTPWDTGGSSFLLSCKSPEEKRELHIWICIFQEKKKRRSSTPRAFFSWKYLDLILAFQTALQNRAEN